MADQIPFGVVEHILTKLGSKAFQEIGSMYGVPKDMTKLKDNLDIIKGVLLDAEEQQQQKTRGIEAWVQKLKGAVYDADDLLDDYATHYLQRGGLARQIMSVSASLKSLCIGSIDDMISLQKDLLQHVSGLVTLQIRECPNLQSLELPSSPSLSELRIINCPNLASFNVASLPRLEELILRGVRAEVLRQFMFVSASSSLKSLHIRKIDGMISLPEEPLQYVSTLETLYIVKCSGLATLLHWMGSLSSLTELIIMTALN